jgi:hypothetical protein
MAKISAKDAVILIGGYKFSTYASLYEMMHDAGPVDVTGFTEGAQNFVPGLPVVTGKLDMFWDSAANTVHPALSVFPTGTYLTILPEGDTLGYQSLSFPMMQSNYTPKGAPAGAITVGGLNWLSYGNNVGLENGVSLFSGTITSTTTGTAVDDPTGGAVTAACGAVLHLWGTPLPADTYVIKVQHSPNGSAWSDLITFSANGATRTAERQIVASGTINRYRRILATRTGSAGDPLGLTLAFYHL